MQPFHPNKDRCVTYQTNIDQCIWFLIPKGMIHLVSTKNKNLYWALSGSDFLKVLIFDCQPIRFGWKSVNHRLSNWNWPEQGNFRWQQNNNIKKEWRHLKDEPEWYQRTCCRLHAVQTLSVAWLKQHMRLTRSLIFESTIIFRLIKPSSFPTPSCPPPFGHRKICHCKSIHVFSLTLWTESPSMHALPCLPYYEITMGQNDQQIFHKIPAIRNNQYPSHF